MRKNIKTTEAIFPMPVLMIATYNEDGSIDVMNAAWGLMIDRDIVGLNLTAIKSENVDAPIINEFPICMECEFIEYQGGEYGAGVIGKVVNVTADESVMNGDNVDISLVNAISFDPYTHGYYKVTERVGNAFSDGKNLMK